MDDLYARLVDLLAAHGARYRGLDHAPEGRTDLVSAMRGHDVSHAAKCMILIVKVGKRVTRYLLGVVPGHARLDLAAVKSLEGATYVSMASPAKAEELCGSVVGTVLPFSFNAEVEVVLDPALLRLEEIYFNAARLDRSFALRVEDYVRIARPRLARIAALEPPSETPR